MRFFADGPNIPDELLVARDEGRVVFFCGAGVSMARAGLPSFINLADQVMAELGTLPDSAPFQELRRVKDARDTISLDRVFGLLEQDFDVESIRRAIARALEPKNEPPDLSSHRTMLDLSRAPDGSIRLVTTNFDPLFCQAGPADLPILSPPDLPDLARDGSFRGIVHLHGRVDETYRRAVGDKFVISVADFGRAYLAEGWATAFVRELMRRYWIVFVGYSADDPPMRYLLEALRQAGGSEGRLYAFQDGSPDRARSLWEHKGVHPIAFDPAENFEALWATLDAWAERAHDPTAWYERVVEMARRGPRALLPHERGQVVHLVSFTEGAARFGDHERPPPAEWLCVFDPAVRYGRPGPTGRMFDLGPEVDPFELYGLDRDAVPPPEISDPYTDRKVPESAWNVFSASALDWISEPEIPSASFAGRMASSPSPLPARLNHLARWFGSVGGEPAAVWWAARQGGLHPSSLWQLRHRISEDSTDWLPAVKEAWRFLMEAWADKRDPDERWHTVKKALEQEGWTDDNQARFADLFRPHLKTSPARLAPVPPELSPELRREALVHVEIEFPARHGAMDPPPETLPSILRRLRQHLEAAVDLHVRIGSYLIRTFWSLTPEKPHAGECINRVDDLFAAVLYFAAQFERLAANDSLAARREWWAWRMDDSTIFARLRLWAAGQPPLLPGPLAGSVFLDLPDDAFWNSHHQRDLLFALAARWADLPASVRLRLERRLKQGWSGWRNANNRRQAAAYRRRGSLERLIWLRSRRCRLSDATDRWITKTSATVGFQGVEADGAIRSHGSRGGWVRIDPNPSTLMGMPLAVLIRKADELRGRNDGDFLVEQDPLKGLIETRPAQVLAGLVHATRTGFLSIRSWDDFLRVEAREKDRTRMLLQIGCRLNALSVEMLAKLLRPAAAWLERLADRLFASFPDLALALLDKLVEAAEAHPQEAVSGVVRRSRRVDWVMEAINSPIDGLAQTLMKQPDLQVCIVGAELPQPWRCRAERLLAQPVPLGQYALVSLASQAVWLHRIDPAWVEASLLSALQGDGDRRAAFWAGYLRPREIELGPLYQRVKPALIDLAAEQADLDGSEGEVAAYLTLGWKSRHPETGERAVTDGEMRRALVLGGDDFRTQTLRYIEQRDEDADDQAQNDITYFLRYVWPLQRVAYSAAVSMRLCEVLITLGDAFPELLDEFLPRLTFLDADGSGMFHQLLNEDVDVVERHPDLVLHLADRILAAPVRYWPYGAEAVLDRIAAADPILAADRRLLELRRRRDMS